MLSNSCKAALKAVIYLASNHESGKKISIKEIAKKIDESEHTISKMLQTLVRQDIIQSLKGPSGGFYITGKQLKQPIMNIVEAIDGKNIFKECGLGLTKCSETHPCPIHEQYGVARDIIENLLRKNKVSDFTDPIKSGVTFLA